MKNQLGIKVQEIVASMDLPEQVESKVIESVFERYITTEGKALEAIDLKIDEQQRAVSGTATKIQNLKFNLIELIIQILETGGGIMGLKGNPFTAILLIIRFLQKLKNLSILPLNERDAQILLVIFQLQQEGDTLNLENLYQHIDRLTEEEIQQTLTRLERLGCITLKMDGVVMHETIDVRLKV